MNFTLFVIIFWKFAFSISVSTNKLFFKNTFSKSVFFKFAFEKSISFNFWPEKSEYERSALEKSTLSNIADFKSKLFNIPKLKFAFSKFVSDVFEGLIMECDKLAPEKFVFVKSVFNIV